MFRVTRKLNKHLNKHCNLGYVLFKKIGCIMYIKLIYIYIFIYLVHIYIFLTLYIQSRTQHTQVLIVSRTLQSIHDRMSLKPFNFLSAVFIFRSYRYVYIVFLVNNIICKSETYAYYKFNADRSVKNYGVALTLTGSTFRASKYRSNLL